MLSTLPNEAPGQPVLHTETTFPVRNGAQISFTASAVDPDGDTLTYEWSVSNGSWTLEATGASAIVTPTERGSTAVLTVTASDGDLTASASRELASTSNVAPTVTLAPADATLLATTTLTLSAQGYDADADALTYAWSVDGEGWAIEADGAAAIVTAPEVVDAAATVTVTATDGWGGEATASHALTTTGVALRGTVDFLQSGGVVIEEAVWQDDRGSQGGPLGLVTTVPLPAGAHTLEAVWRISDGADRGFRPRHR